MERSTQRFPAGWYPNQAGPGFRYWDGSHWTEYYLQPEPEAEATFEQQTAGVASGQTDAAAPGNLLRARIVALIAIVAGAASLGVAIAVPNSPTETLVNGGYYVKPVYHSLLVFGGAEAIVLGIVLAVKTAAWSSSRWISPLTAAAAAISVVMLATGGAIYFSYKTAEEDSPASRPPPDAGSSDLLQESGPADSPTRPPPDAGSSDLLQESGPANSPNP